MNAACHSFQAASHRWLSGVNMSAEPILIVDDNPQIRRALRTILISQGFVVMDARTGEEALDLIREERVELILLDVNLPGMSGIETCREIRRGGAIPVIMLTVRNSERDKMQAFEAGGRLHCKTIWCRRTHGARPRHLTPRWIGRISRLYLTRL